MLKISSLFAASASVLFLSACGQTVAPQSSAIKAVVSEAQAEEAFKIVQGITYLPFTYIVDGCYARSLYMSMELAAQSIPSSAHYIYGDLNPTSDVEWSYHVAPLLKVGDETPWILDPAFEKEPLRLPDWIKHNNPDGRYQTEIKAGSAYFDDTGRTSEFNNSHMIQNFAEMPTFLTSDIGSACTVMYNYIGNENLTSSQIKAKRTRLLSRTTSLISGLDDVEKLENDGLGRDVNSSCRSAIGE